VAVNDKYLYGERPAEVESAAGAKGVLIRTLDGALMFRVYRNREQFTDYEDQTRRPERHDRRGRTGGVL
jgi:hypothetical protein